jgi:hypothetical protein
MVDVLILKNANNENNKKYRDWPGFAGSFDNLINGDFGL